MNTNYMSNGEGFVVNKEAVLKEKAMCSIVKNTVHMLNDNPYLSVGDWIKSLSNIDIFTLVDMVNIFLDERDLILAIQEAGGDPFEVTPSEEGSNLIILSEMLASAESCSSLSFAETYKNVTYLSSVIACENIFRLSPEYKYDYNSLSFATRHVPEVFKTK